MDKNILIQKNEKFSEKYLDSYGVWGSQLNFAQIEARSGSGVDGSVTSEDIAGHSCSCSNWEMVLVKLAYSECSDLKDIFSIIDPASVRVRIREAIELFNGSMHLIAISLPNYGCVAWTVA